MSNKWTGFSQFVIDSNKRTQIAWKRYPTEILYGEMESLLKRFNLRTNRENVLIASTITKIYTENSEIFYLDNSEEHEKSYSANIGKLLFNRVKTRSDPDNEARKMLKVWMGSSLEEFLPELNRIIKFNKKSGKIIPLDNLYYFCEYWNENIEQKISNISRDYAKSKFTINKNTEKEDK